MSRLQPKTRPFAHRVFDRIRPLHAAGADDASALRSPSTEPEGVAPSQPEVISSLDELETKLGEIEAAYGDSHDAMREVFGSFTMAAPTDLPADPYSEEYSERQFEFYRFISGRDDYEIESERSDFPASADRPFPYYTESADTVGSQIMAIGFIIKTLGLPAGSSILELGPGWGNTTIELARMGYDVTAIDIDPTFVDLIRERANRLSLTVDVRRGAFSDIDQLGRAFDAILFYESFHHCADHLELIRSLDGVLAAGGKVVFAAEPVTDTFPMPWGVRTDGEALWAMRQFGWLELGFRESYFLRMLAHFGWIADKQVAESTYLGIVFEARRANGVYELSTFVLPPEEDATWALPEPPGVRLRHTKGRSLISLERGRSSTTVRIEGVNTSPDRVPYRVQHGRETTTGTVPVGEEFVIRLPYDETADTLVIEAAEWRPADLLGSIDTRVLGLGVRTITLD